MAETDLSSWLSIADAALVIGCSKRTVERLGKGNKLEARLRRQEGTPPVLVFSPESVHEEAQRRRTAPAPFVVRAGSNGNGHRALVEQKKFQPGTFPVPGGDDLIRGLALLISKALQSPPSPPVAESRGGDYEYLTIREAAAACRLTQAYVRRRCEAGAVPAIKDRGWRIRRKDLEAL